MRWEFTPDEFMHVWAETGLDRYPLPLNLLSSVRWEDEYDKLSAEIRARRPVGSDPDLTAVLRVAADPDSSFALFGTRKRPVRAYGAIFTDTGVTLVQRPSPTPEFGGNVLIETGSPAIVPRVFAAVLGELPKGRRPPLVESLDKLGDTDVGWTSSKPQVVDHMRRLLKAPRDGSGHIEARHGLHDRTPLPPSYLSWFDVTDDGRYLYRQRYRDFHIDPISHDELRTELARMIEFE
ncbi:ESX secretion-associated protein EspG [Nocardia donostiensis]|uniref:ESX secretion-associated protein EspG n=1 Tax=Nocardia donostiensis TaxID=1538463 RepID=A0A1V2TM81_9NOCA|nr:ESX secretion-associated protein EspG [Nocardia donostiensis]ONM50599.1 hypothetical protein B0T46_01485 [Nocardia donostiensis]OQS17168.1 hypothetical protein B0T36_00685 [Nocardia donostiensis]OQS20757.1 hypothetical protein B0T44_08980 [Nocardia donostiensis]